MLVIVSSSYFFTFIPRYVSYVSFYFIIAFQFVVYIIRFTAKPTALGLNLPSTWIFGLLYCELVIHSDARFEIGDLAAEKWANLQLINSNAWIANRGYRTLFRPSEWPP